LSQKKRARNYYCPPDFHFSSKNALPFVIFFKALKVENYGSLQHKKQLSFRFFVQSFPPFYPKKKGDLQKISSVTVVPPRKTKQKQQLQTTKN
jgi:hypothetical protein